MGSEDVTRNYGNGKSKNADILTGFADEEQKKKWPKLLHYGRGVDLRLNSSENSLKNLSFSRQSGPNRRLKTPPALSKVFCQVGVPP